MEQDDASDVDERRHQDGHRPDLEARSIIGVEAFSSSSSLSRDINIRARDVVSFRFDASNKERT